MRKSKWPVRGHTELCKPGMTGASKARESLKHQSIAEGEHGGTGGVSGGAVQVCRNHRGGPLPLALSPQNEQGPRAPVCLHSLLRLSALALARGQIPPKLSPASYA